MGLLRISCLIPQMLRTNKFTPEQVKTLQDKRLRRLLRHAVSKSEYFRDLYRDIDLETCSTSDLPIVTRKMMMENFDRYVTDQRLKRAEIGKWLSNKDNLDTLYLDRFIPFTTSGTTGENALVVYDQRAIDHVHAAVMARHARETEPTLAETAHQYFKALFVRKLKMATIFMTGGPYPASTTANHEPKAHNLFVNLLKLSLLDPIPKLVAELNAHQPQLLISYPSILETLAREQIAGRLKLKLDPKFATIASGSEPLSETTKRWVYKAWNMHIQDTYGSAECLIMARSCGQFENMHVMTDLCILEVVDRNYNPVPDGAVGQKVLITNLFNYTQPFIRYELSDVTGISTEHCSCGLPFPTLLPVEGRTDDIFYIDSPNGGYEEIHPYLFAPIVQLDEVQQYQLAQTGRNEISFRYVPAKRGTNIEQKVHDVLARCLDSAGLSGRIKLITEQVETIPRDPKSGKFRQIISLVGSPADLNESNLVKR